MRRKDKLRKRDLKGKRANGLIWFERSIVSRKSINEKLAGDGSRKTGQIKGFEPQARSDIVFHSKW